MKFLFAVVFALVASCQGQNLIELLEESGQTTALDLLEQAGLTEALEGDGPLTVFLPKQEVFDALPQEIVDAITSDVDLLTAVLTYHVVAGDAPSSALANELLLPTVNGADLRVNLYVVADATVATVAGVPIDLTQVDIQADNGIVHFLDGVILNVPAADSAGSLGLVSETTGQTFDALVYALESAGLLADLAAGTDITVLAPIDSEGFTVDIVDELLADPDALAAILLDHVASGTIFSAGIGQSVTVTTEGGNTIMVVYTEDKGYIVTDADGNELADVIAGDIPTTQGVLHIIDRPIIL